jgi:hypothetical protein
VGLAWRGRRAQATGAAGLSSRARYPHCASIAATLAADGAASRIEWPLNFSDTAQRYACPSRPEPCITPSSAPFLNTVRLPAPRSSRSPMRSPLALAGWMPGQSPHCSCRGGGPQGTCRRSSCRPRCYVVVRVAPAAATAAEHWPMQHGAASQLVDELRPVDARGADHGAGCTAAVAVIDGHRHHRTVLSERDALVARLEPVSCYVYHARL